jgi:hypothetical protein
MSKDQRLGLVGHIMPFTAGANGDPVVEWCRGRC